MTTITARDALEAVTGALRGQKIPDDAVAAIANEFVAAEVAGTKTHGLGKAISMNYGEPTASPIIEDFGGLMVIDGQRSCGFVLFRDLAERLRQRALEGGGAIAFVRNFSRISSLHPYTEAVVGSSSGMISILANSAGPPAVVPFGGIDPITGTNPICMSFPTSGGPHSLDMSTSALVWGEIRQASLEGRPLAPDVFLDAAGRSTQEPGTVEAVRAFGGAKGWTLNLALEVLCGGAPGAKMGGKVEDEFDCGACFIAIDAGRSGSGLGQRADALLDEVRHSRSEGEHEVRAPGDRRRGRPLTEAQLAAVIEVPESTLERLGLMADGHTTEELASDPRFN